MADVLPVTVAPSVPNMAGFEAVLIVVVTTETEGCIVVAPIVVAGMTMVVSTVDIGVGNTVLMIAALDTPFDTAVVTTDARTTLSGDVMVDSCMVVAGTVVSEKVVVKVRVTSSPSALAGIAVPTPDAVN